MQKIKKAVLLTKLCVRQPKTIIKGFRYIKNNGMDNFLIHVKGKASNEMFNASRQIQLDETKSRYYDKLKFSIIMPVYNVEIKWLEKAIESIEAQNYINWELCIADDCSTDPRVREYLERVKNDVIKVVFLEKNGGISAATNEAAKMAEGDYLVLMDNDDEISHDALFEFAKAIKNSDADIIYSDQDIVDMEGNHRDPLFKPDWSPDLLLSQMYIGHLLGFKKGLFEKVGGFRSEFNGSQDYDLMLRMTEHTKKVAHVSKILYSWRDLPSSTAANPHSKPYAQTAGLNAIQDHLDRVYGKGNAEAKETADLFVYDVRYKLRENVKASIIIPTKDHAKLLGDVVESIQKKTAYRNFEIIILNNNSEEKATFEYFDQVVKEYDNVRVEEASYEFNWSRLNNHGIRIAEGDVFIFLNNDMQVITEDWLERLVEKAVREDVGTVGALLLFEDGTIQHAGVIAAMGGWADHVFRGMNPVHYGSPFISPMVTRNVTASTGACLAISRKTIEKIGNFDEKFIICGSDVEISVRANQHGLVNIYDPFARLYHYESKSRDSYIPQIDFDLSDKMYKVYREEGDPYYNRQLDYNSCVPKAKSGVQEAPETDYSGMRIEAAGISNIGSNVAEITPYNFRPCAYNRKRINLLVPSINPEHVFGGISTAIKFFEEFVEEMGYDSRMILTDAEPGNDVKDGYNPKYNFVEAEEESHAAHQIVPYSNRYGRSIPVSEKDVFMFTGWWTAHCAQEAYEEFEKQYRIRPKKFINFIQDYEPGFYPWSTRFLLADATYKNHYPQIAIFNTGLLKEYFDFNKYKFYREFVFEPVLNKTLKERLYKADSIMPKKKQILVYGRPGTERNAFDLIVDSLKKWVWMQPDIAEWTILSAGEKFKDIPLGNGKKLESVGKLTIDEYADVLTDTYAGISLMASPHPSYPPLEMSVFEIKVITNTYANKDLSSFNDNMVSLDNISPTNIANRLLEICENYSPQVRHELKNKDYCENSNIFWFKEEVGKILEEE